MRQNKKNKKILAGFEPGSSVSLAAALPTPPPGLLLQPRRKMGYINKTGLSHAQDCAKHLQIFFANASHAQICAKNTCKFFFGNPPHALTYSTSDFFKKDSRISFFCVKPPHTSTHASDLRKYIFLRNCANCAKICAGLCPCASKNHFIAPRIRAFRRLGKLHSWKKITIFKTKIMVLN